MGAFVLDFYCVELALAIEVDGGVHQEPEQRERDRSRQQILEEAGVRFLRVSAAEVERDIAAVLQRLDAFARSHPHPSPRG